MSRAGSFTALLEPLTVVPVDAAAAGQPGVSPGASVTPSIPPAPDQPSIEAGGESTAALADAAPGTPPRPPGEPLGSSGSAAPASRWRDIALGVLSVVVLALVAFVFDGHRDRSSLRLELAQRLAAADELGRQSQALAVGAQRTVREMEVGLSGVEAQLAESQSQQIALEALYQDLARGRDEAALAEIEQSLIAANQQLTLAGNVRVALIALQSADARLALADRPQLAPLRRALAADIERLQGVPRVDTVGIAVRLDRAAAAIDLLPTAPVASVRELVAPDSGAAGGEVGQATDPKAAELPPDPLRLDATVPAAAANATATVTADGSGTVSAVPQSSSWRDTLRRVWAEFRAEFRQLASLRRIDQEALPLITPEQAWFLRENLRLRLLSARLALLARDETSFRHDISAARGWIARYFDVRDPSALALTEILRELERAEIRIDLPEIGASIEAVRALRVSRDRRP